MTTKTAECVGLEPTGRSPDVEVFEAPCFPIRVHSILPSVRSHAFRIRPSPPNGWPRGWYQGPAEDTGLEPARLSAQTISNRHPNQLRISSIRKRRESNPRRCLNAAAFKAVSSTNRTTSNGTIIDSQISPLSACLPQRVNYTMRKLPQPGFHWQLRS
jgi:hypothetical protein